VRTRAEGAKGEEQGKQGNVSRHCDGCDKELSYHARFGPSLSHGLCARRLGDVRAGVGHVLVGQGSLAFSFGR